MRVRPRKETKRVFGKSHDRGRVRFLKFSVMKHVFMDNP